MPTLVGRAENGRRPVPGSSTVLLIASVSGFCGMAYELLWSRGLLAAITDDTTYAFTLMLTAFLAGHALGAAIAGRSGRECDPKRLAVAGDLFRFSRP